ncbi:class I SAM-dependent methyltransferase [Cohnella panacarvi]|uniref:class I SAM-dependent methyltransferase n=1 Tax=Cohnella panacarvi TaxID=400776 RepID=UPI0004787B90|nr:class I SAM-dependent methyltransferase [Cohnella panacarvi]
MSEHERIYREQASGYDDMISRQPNLATCIREIRPWAGLDVLDLGAGSGRLSSFLAAEADSLICTDKSEAMLELLDRKLSGLYSTRNWRTACADHRSLPLADSSVDLVIAGWTISYLTNSDEPDWENNLERIMGELTRVLKPGGTIIIMETMGTGCETPQAPPFLDGYYSLLEQRYGFSHRWIRTDYEFASVEDARARTEFFFGEGLARLIEEKQWRIVPECAGIWWKHV